MSAKYAAAHVAPTGPGDARPTAQAIVQDEGLVGKLQGKVILVTGCSPGGLGVEVARALYSTGAHLFLTVRDVKKGEETLTDIRAHHEGSGGTVELLALDLDSLQSVRECAIEFLRRSKQLHILINNAGVMACAEGVTKDGFETQFGTNHLGHFLLFQLLKPALLASSTPAFHSRVVSVSSSGHRFSAIRFDDLNLKKMGYQPWVAYGQSKTANIYMANEIERLYGAKGLHATSVHPGMISTSLGRHVDPQVLQSLVDPVKHMLKSQAQGAATIVWAAVGKEWEGKGGKYLEDCSVSAPRASDDPNVRLGYSSYAYDEVASKKLWAISLSLVNAADD